MSNTQIFIDRTTSTPTITPNTLTFVADAPEELRILLSNADGTKRYITPTFSDIDLRLNATLSEPGGALDRVAALEATAHTHTDLTTLNALGVNSTGDLTFNGEQVAYKLLTEELW